MTIMVTYKAFGLGKPTPRGGGGGGGGRSRNRNRSRSRSRSIGSHVGLNRVRVIPRSILTGQDVVEFEVGFGRTCESYVAGRSVSYLTTQRSRPNPLSWMAVKGGELTKLVLEMIF